MESWIEVVCAEPREWGSKKGQECGHLVASIREMAVYDGMAAGTIKVACRRCRAVGGKVKVRNVPLRLTSAYAQT